MVNEGHFFSTKGMCLDVIWIVYVTFSFFAGIVCVTLIIGKVYLNLNL